MERCRQTGNSTERLAAADMHGMPAPTPGLPMLASTEVEGILLKASGSVLKVRSTLHRGSNSSPREAARSNAQIGEVAGL